MRTRTISTAGVILLLTLTATIETGCAVFSRDQNRYYELPPNLPQLYEKARESTVLIKTEKKVGPERKHARSHYGTGIVIASQRLDSGEFEARILTNRHVLDRAHEIYIKTPQYEKEYKGKILWLNEAGTYDVAIAVVILPENLPPVEFRDSETLKIGEWAFTIGNPHPNSWRLSFGTVGNIWQDVNNKREIDFDGGVNPGNSGGGVFDMRGKLIGIVYGVWGHSSGAVVPSDVIRELIREWEQMQK